MNSGSILVRQAATCSLAWLCAAGSLRAQDEIPREVITPEQKREVFEEAMRRLEEARLAQAEKAALEAARGAAAQRDAEQLREVVEGEAEKVAEGSIDGANQRLLEAEAFAAAAAGKVPEDARAGFIAGAKPAPAPAPAVKPSVDAEGPGAGGEPRKGARGEPRGDKPKAETIIDADGRVIFDGTGRFGKDYQVVIFEENVVVTNPDFVIHGDMLTAYFRRAEKPPAAEGEAPVAPLPAEEPPAGAVPAETPAAETPAAEDEGSSQLERAVITGREVVVRKHAAEGEEEQIAKARKVTYFAAREEVMLEIWPQVQRGGNLVIAKSRDTVIVLKGDEMIVTGPVRTQIVRQKKKDGTSGTGIGPATPPPAEAPGAAPDGDADPSPEVTVIDASRGAVFNRPGREAKTREIFFDGQVSVESAKFDIFARQLTAYLREGKEGSEVYKTIAEGTETEKAVVQRRAPNGEVQIGNAGRITHLASNDDVILDIWPEIHRDVHSGVAKYREAQVVLKKDGNVETRGVDMQIVQEDGSTLRLGTNKDAATNGG